MTAIGYVILVAVVSAATAQHNDRIKPNDDRIPSRILEGPERIIPIPYTLQLPSNENPIPFYNPEISTDLRPPINSYNIPVQFYEYPVPSQELQAPNLEPWNPNNEETYYYSHEYPIGESDIEKPTNSHPKKFNKEVHEKIKLVYANPKGDTPKVDSRDELEQQKKALERFNKVENRKQVEAEKVVKSNDQKKPEEPLAEASDHYNDIEDISTSFTHSLGVRFPGERVQFHMHGHKGPNSYKWGYDTGKGHNRQFRVEERDHDGYLKGQYGYVDKHGKLQMFDYFSDPKGGYTSKKHTGDRK